MKKSDKKPAGRPRTAITAIQFEKELTALQRLNKAGHLRDNEFNDKYVTLLTAFRKNQ